jgi:8-oxo-dGTP pyrophosphatase MutT (NUDIX family)
MKMAPQPQATQTEPGNGALHRDTLLTTMSDTTAAEEAIIKNDAILSKIVESLGGLSPNDRSIHAELPRASILVPLFRRPTKKDNDDDDWHVLLTQRPLHLKSHPGEVCFPGGRQEDQDEGDDIRTAVRETQEEVGIPRDEIVPVARMETIESVGGLCVTPIVSILRTPIVPSELSLCPTEVEAAFSVPLSYFWNDDNCDSAYDIEWRGMTVTMRTYFYTDTSSASSSVSSIPQPSRTFKIWGLTAYVIYEVAKLCKPKAAPRATLKPAVPVAKTTGPESETILMAGHLYRWVDDTSGSKPYWAQRYLC